MPKPAHTGALVGELAVGGFSGGSGHSNGVHEALGVPAQHREALGRRHRRHHLHERQSFGIERSMQLGAFFERQIRHDEAGDSGLRRGSRQAP
jgi:hypothetical protein